MLFSEEFMDRIYMIYKICFEMKNQFSACENLIPKTWRQFSRWIIPFSESC